MPLTFKIDKWDSYFFRKKVAKISAGERINAKDVSDLVLKAKKKNISFLIAHLSGKSWLYEKNLLSLGFKAYGEGVDLLLSVKKPLRAIRSPYVRAFKEKDLSALYKIAANAFTLSYLYKCGIAAKSEINRYHSTWVKNLSADKRGLIYVLEVDKKICGFAAFKFNERQNTGRLALIAIKNDCRGKGLGKILLKSALSLASLRAKRIFVKTQRENFRAISLYYKLGFKLNAFDKTLCLKIR